MSVFISAYTLEWLELAGGGAVQLYGQLAGRVALYRVYRLYRAAVYGVGLS